MLILFKKQRKKLKARGRSNDNDEDLGLFEDDYDYVNEPTQRKKRERHIGRLNNAPRVTPIMSTRRGDLSFFGGQGGVGRPSSGCICRCDCCECCPCQEGDLIYVDK